MSPEESKITLETLFKPSVKNPNQEKIVMAAKKGKREHGSVRAMTLAIFTNNPDKTFTVNDVIEKVHIKDGKVPDGSLRSTLALLKRQGHIVTHHKEGRAEYLQAGSGQPVARKVAMATGTLENDLRALDAALSVLRGLQPVLERLKERLAKLQSAL